MTMLDPTTLAALRAAKEKATAGPWELENQYCLSASECAVHIIGPRSDVLFESSNSDTRETDYDADENGTTYYDVGSRANFAYIVLLVNSAAALLDAAEENVRLRKAGAALLAELDNITGISSGLPQQGWLSKVISASDEYRTALERIP